jgi:hypothetical protein
MKISKEDKNLLIYGVAFIIVLVLMGFLAAVII